MQRAKHAAWRFAAACVCLLSLSNVARADSLDEQRNRYAQIKQAWDNKQMDVVSQLMLAIPMCLLYELGIFLSRFVTRTRVDEAVSS